MTRQDTQLLLLSTDALGHVECSNINRNPIMNLFCNDFLRAIVLSSVNCKAACTFSAGFRKGFKNGDLYSRV